MNSERPAGERHVPVLRDRCINLLAPAIERAIEERGRAVVVDATLGMGGHSEAMLQRFPQLHVVGIDRDEQALALAGERLRPFAERTDLVHAVYDEIADAVEDLGFGQIDGALFDLGVSSLQLDERDRGFAYSYDAPLDMRMDTSRGMTAADVVNTYSRGGSRTHHPALGRGEVRRPHRLQHCCRPGRRPADHHGRAGGSHPQGGAGRCGPDRRPSGQTDIPGTAHRSQ